MEIAMVPPTSQTAPATMSVGSTQEFTVLLDPNGVGDLVGVQFSIRFDPNALEVIGITHVNTTLDTGIGSLVNNNDGTAKFAAFTVSPLGVEQEPFEFATVTLGAKAVPNGGIALVVFEFAQDGSGTSVSDTLGRELLKVSGDFTGAWIEIVP